MQTYLIPFSRILSLIDSYIVVGGRRCKTFMGNQNVTNCSSRTLYISRLDALISDLPQSHYNSRTEIYPRNDRGHPPCRRFLVPDDKVSWDVPFPEYEPVDYTMKFIIAGTSFTDPQDFCTHGTPMWNTVEGVINRHSYVKTYEIIAGVPRNPIGRTGMIGRGTMGRFGPNHAADPIVTRWKRDSAGNIIHCVDGRPVLQFVAILRRDDHEWAIPGGMIDAGEAVPVTLRREFSEEAMDYLHMSTEEKNAIRGNVDTLFDKGGELVYKGYSDDPRNTDNAWIETVAVNYHDETGNSVSRFKLHAGDDAVGVKWTDINKSLHLFASHVLFLETVAKRHGAFW